MTSVFYNFRWRLFIYSMIYIWRWNVHDCHCRHKGNNYDHSFQKLFIRFCNISWICCSFRLSCFLDFLTRCVYSSRQRVLFYLMVLHSRRWFQLYLFIIKTLRSFSLFVIFPYIRISSNSSSFLNFFLDDSNTSLNFSVYACISISCELQPQRPSISYISVINGDQIHQLCNNFLYSYLMAWYCLSQPFNLSNWQQSVFMSNCSFYHFLFYVLSLYSS